MVNKYSANESNILQRDFYYSLLAAFTPKEIQEQLANVGITELKIKEISDRHVLIYGEKSEQDDASGKQLIMAYTDYQNKILDLILPSLNSYTMQRTVEPELMDDKAQAEAYAAADFEQAHRLIVDTFDLYFPNVELEGHILDLGCGPGDITFRFAARFQKSVVVGVDGSSEMIRLANERKDRENSLSDRITFLKGILPDARIPKVPYSAVVSNSLLHHLHRPEVLWQTLIQYTSPGTIILIADLYRPKSIKEAKQMVNEYSANEPDILQSDFYNSLLAAFTPKEIQEQLDNVSLTELKIKKISDRHVLIYGEKS